MQRLQGVAVRLIAGVAGCVATSVATPDQAARAHWATRARPPLLSNISWEWRAMAASLCTEGGTDAALLHRP